MALGMKGATALPIQETLFFFNIYLFIFVIVVGVLFCFVTGSLYIGLELVIHRPPPSPTRIVGKAHHA